MLPFLWVKPSGGRFENFPLLLLILEDILLGQKELSPPNKRQYYRLCARHCSKHFICQISVATSGGYSSKFTNGKFRYLVNFPVSQS